MSGNLAILEQILENSMRKIVPSDRFGILFSGGIDSSLVALLSKKLSAKPVLYTAALELAGFESKDAEAAKKVAAELDLPLKVNHIHLNDVEKYLKKVIPLLKSTDVVQVGVALTVYAAAELAAKDGIKLMLAGAGSDELFGGYSRFRKSTDINADCRAAFLKMKKTDLKRDELMLSVLGISLNSPFLDEKLIDFALALPKEEKLSETQTKIILRGLAEKLGLPKELALRKKLAAQYGSGFDKAIEKLTRKAGLKSKSEYLYQFYQKPNLKLAALFSSGKDSTYAMHILKNQNYEVSCLVTIESANPDSYMYHTPNISLASLQAESMQIPIIVHKTKGEKEKELAELEAALKEAVEKYKIEGVVCGAFASTYQRDRVQRICENLNLRLFAPLWGKEQEAGIREMVKAKIKFIIVKIASQGLDKSWLGREITEKDIDKLVEINEKFGFNVAGEGGEFETLVLDAPMFKKQLKILESEIKEESEHVAELIIKKAELKEK